MARVMRLVDDLDPTKEADRTVVFAMDGVIYAIDLAEEHIGPMRQVMEPYLEAGRRVGRVDQAVMRTATEPPPSTNAGRGEIRNWAASVGMECPPRGNIPTKVREAYDRAHRV